MRGSECLARLIIALTAAPILSEKESYNHNNETTPSYAAVPYDSLILSHNLMILSHSTSPPRPLVAAAKKKITILE